MRDELKLGPGDIYDGDVAVEDVNRLLRLYRKEAYIDAQIRRAYIASTEGTGLTVVYNITEGRQISIDGIIIKGNLETRDKVIRRELTFYPQEPMNVDKFQESMSNLFRLNYFDNNVSIYPEPASTSESRDVIVDVTEGTTGQVLFGFGSQVALDRSAMCAW